MVASAASPSLANDADPNGDDEKKQHASDAASPNDDDEKHMPLYVKLLAEQHDYARQKLARVGEGFYELASSSSAHRGLAILFANGGSGSVQSSSHNDTAKMGDALKELGNRGTQHHLTSRPYLTSLPHPHTPFALMQTSGEFLHTPLNSSRGTMLLCSPKS